MPPAFAKDPFMPSPSPNAPPLIVLPARMASTRLPGKPLADIAGKPMIAHVIERARAAHVGPVVVACCEEPVARAAARAGAQAVMTDPDLPSGSDRVWAAVQSMDPKGRHDLIINVQADLPTLDPVLIRDVLGPMSDPLLDIATPVAPIVDPAEITDPGVVKAVLALRPGARTGRALYFSRQAVPHGAGPYLHHIGLYAYRRDALRRFVDLPPSPLETREKLEQLRALEDGMRIAAVIVDTVPLGVDTPADLEKARTLLARLRPA
jgi:3-deoxy-manno-octulosonate cytidylyltransferase (CMP-KDO synthetase)